ncbi:xanthine dehydrogenase small subunit [Undibacterium squillarum]|nr:xanthine dehydrogenase small subunit [Undibacterium squillarum]
MSSPIRFFHASQLHTVSDQPVTRTLLQYLREDAHCTSVKEGCAEGDCGACTVVVGELCNGKLQMRSANACLLPLASLHGKAVFTADQLGDEQKPHPIQEAMVSCHGSQCGFCTPGFMMSMWSVYLQRDSRGGPASREEIQQALSGNLCRCTGYRPIVDAMQVAEQAPEHPFDRQALSTQLAGIADTGDFHYSAQKQHWHAPRTMDALLRLRHALPNATLVAGSTDIGLWITKQFRPLGDFISVAKVEALHHCERTDEGIFIGAAVSVEQAYRACLKEYPELSELADRFASLPVRNTGTLGGNIANGSPIGDSMPWLIALGARIELASVSGTRQIPLEAFYTGYRQKDLQANEVVGRIIIPLRTSASLFRVWKISKRIDQDISAVCIAFSATLNDGRLQHVRIGAGGVAAIPARARQTEAVLEGSMWDQAALEKACAAIAAEFTPLSDMRASAAYRRQLCVNLLKRFWLETSPASDAKDKALSLTAYAAAGDQQ